MQFSRSRNKINIRKIALLILLLISLSIYFMLPSKGIVSMLFFYICFGLMLVSNYIYFKAKKKNNYLDFDTIFIVIYCLVGFSTTFFYNNYEIFRAIFLGFPVDEEYINKGNMLFLIGLQSYMIGSLVPIKISKVEKKYFVIKTNFLVMLVFVLIFAFIGLGGINYYRSEYNATVTQDSGAIVKYVLLLLVTSAMALIGTEFYNKKINTNYRISWFAFSALLVLIGILLVIGNRTAASQILLPIICLYAFFFKRISLKKFFLFILAGIPFMWFFQQIRTGDLTLELTNPIMLILDLTIPMRNTYAALEYVNTNDYNYGATMVLNLSSVIPFLPSYIQDEYPDLALGSAELLTNYTFVNARTPEEFQIGLGTTIIADIYLAFGVIGILIFMYTLGYLVNRWLSKSYQLNYYSIIILCGMLGNAIFMVRAGYFHPFRFIIWALILAYINNFLHRVWKR